MFIWFVFRDHATSEWQSGLRTTSGAAKPSLARFTAAATPLDARNAIVNVKGGIANPTVTVALRAYGAGHEAGRERRLQRHGPREGQARRERPADRRRSAATRRPRSG